MTANHLSNIGFDIEPTGIIIILRCASEANAFVSIYLANLQPGGSRETLDSTFGHVLYRQWLANRPIFRILNVF
jgi:hypothetical protein